MTLEELRDWMVFDTPEGCRPDCGIWGEEIACLDAAIAERDRLNNRLLEIHTAAGEATNGSGRSPTDAIRDMAKRIAELEHDLESAIRKGNALSGHLIERLEKAEATVERCRGVLRDVEWSEISDLDWEATCPWCEGMYMHAPDCIYDALMCGPLSAALSPAPEAALRESRTTESTLARKRTEAEEKVALDKALSAFANEMRAALHHFAEQGEQGWWQEYRAANRQEGGGE